VSALLRAASLSALSYFMTLYEDADAWYEGEEAHALVRQQDLGRRLFDFVYQSSDNL